MHPKMHNSATSNCKTVTTAAMLHVQVAAALQQKAAQEAALAAAQAAANPATTSPTQAASTPGPTSPPAPAPQLVAPVPAGPVIKSGSSWVEVSDPPAAPPAPESAVVRPSANSWVEVTTEVASHTASTTPQQQHQGEGGSLPVQQQASGGAPTGLVKGLAQSWLGLQGGQG